MRRSDRKREEWDPLEEVDWVVGVVDLVGKEVVCYVVMVEEVEVDGEASQGLSRLRSQGLSLDEWP